MLRFWRERGGLYVTAASSCAALPAKLFRATTIAAPGRPCPAGFYKSFQSKLRSLEQGADTTVWLCLQACGGCFSVWA